MIFEHFLFYLRFSFGIRFFDGSPASSSRARFAVEYKKKHIHYFTKLYSDIFTSIFTKKNGQNLTKSRLNKMEKKNEKKNS